MSTKGRGVIPDPFDKDDHYYRAQATNVAAAAFWYEERAGRCKEVWGSDGPSRLFIYWLARGGYKEKDHDIVGVSDNGAFTRNALKGIAKVGACAEVDCPFVDYKKTENDVSKIKPHLKGNAFDDEVRARKDKIVNTKPSDTAFGNADPHKITSYYRLDLLQPNEHVKELSTSQKDKIGSAVLENLKKCLTEGFPVTFSFWFYLEGNYAFDESKKPFVLRDVWKGGSGEFLRHTLPKDQPQGLVPTDAGGHSVLAIGYNESLQQVLVQNSWGKKWSGNGTFWVPYAWITDFAATFDFWTIRTTHTSPDPPKFWQQVHQEILAAAPDDSAI